MTGPACGQVLEVEPVPADLQTAPGFQQRVFHLEAPCMVNVEGFGLVDIEEDYLPNVVACENGTAPMEALKAQAVQARGFLYYKLLVTGVEQISNSQGDQVYRCDYRPNGAGPEHIEAVQATRGQYLTWDDSIIASFYVAGNRPPNPDPADPVGSCNGAGGQGDLGTEDLVTYNWNKSACGIDLSTIGWVPEDCRRNPHNRGCASQNGQSCLANLGWKYQDMVRYYYGDDIQLVSGDGRCGGPPPRELTDFDRFCGLKADGDHCYGDTTRVRCEDEYATEDEVCAGGCESGSCVEVEEPDEGACADRADGFHCTDNVHLVECLGSNVEMIEACQYGCADLECREAPEVGDTPSVPGSMESDTDSPNLDGAAGEESSEFPPLVGPSSGDHGGCAAARAKSSPAWMLLMFLGVLGLNNQRRVNGKRSR